MTGTVLTLCRPQVAAGFRLAGVPTVEAANPEQASQRIQESLGDPQLGVILVEDTLYDHLTEETRHRLSRHPLPMLVPFPAPAWQAQPESAEGYIVELLRQVVGYRVRIR